MPAARHFRVPFNQNIGVLTFAGFVIAATTMYLNVRVKQADERKEEKRRCREVMRMLEASMDEIGHNVQHFAYEVDDADEFLSFPATTFEATLALLEGPSLTYLRPQVITRLTDLRRILAHNRATLRSAAEVDGSLRRVALIDLTGIVSLSGLQASGTLLEPSKAKADEPGVHISKPVRIRFDERVLTHSVRFLMEAAFFHHSEVEVPRELGSTRWLEAFLQEMREKGNYCYFHKSSDLKVEIAANLRAKRSRLFCWIKDRDIEGVEIVGLRTNFRDIHHRRH